MNTPRARRLAAVIEHTLLKPEATAQDIDRLCDQAMHFGFAAVCVNPIFIAQAAGRLSGSRAGVVSVADFPLGASTTAVKVGQARQAIDDGAREIDMVARVGELIAGRAGAVQDDIAAVAEAVHACSADHVLKVILETAALNDEQVILGCRCCVRAGADFVKTSTGFHPAGGATIEAVRLLRAHAGSLKVKAAGGIRDLATALAMLEAGADRLGMSNSIAVLSELPQG